MFCSNCGADIAEGTRFCPSCGSEIISNAKTGSHSDFYNSDEKIVYEQPFETKKYSGFLLFTGLLALANFFYRCWEFWHRFVSVPSEWTYGNRYDLGEMPDFLTKSFSDYLINFGKLVDSEDIMLVLQYFFGLTAFVIGLIFIVLCLVAAIKAMAQKNIFSCRSIGTKMIIFSVILYVTGICSKLIWLDQYSAYIPDSYLSEPRLWLEEILFLILAVVPPVLYRVAAAKTKK